MRVSGLSAVLLVAVMSAQGASAQTAVKAPKNKYTPAQDVELGQEAAAQVEQQLPILRDDNVTSYVQEIGRRLVDAIPADLRHPEFRYTFKVVNVREINAFALPGGPMFVNRGMIEAAKTEGEVAGVMAHEMSHVALRHGTAQATKATKYEIGTIAGAVLGAIVGGQTGQRHRAGHAVRPRHRVPAIQPRIREAGGHRGRADHGARRLRPARHGQHVQDDRGAGRLRRAAVAERSPEPGRPLRLHQQGSGVAARRRTCGNDTRRLPERQGAARARCRRRRRPSRRPRMAAARAVQSGLRRAPTDDRQRRRGLRPSFKAYNEGNVFRISVPSNWRELPGNNSVTFAPEGAYGTADRQSVFTHGARSDSRATRRTICRRRPTSCMQSLAQSNPRLRQSSGYNRVSIGDRDRNHARRSTTSRMRPGATNASTSSRR